MERHRRNTREATRQLLRATTEIRDVLDERSMDRWWGPHAAPANLERRPKRYFAFPHTLPREARDSSTPYIYWYLAYANDIDTTLELDK